jgi:hypothetical protein
MHAKYRVRGSEAGGVARSGLRSSGTKVIASLERLRFRRLGGVEGGGQFLVVRTAVKKNSLHKVVQSPEIQP